MSSLLINSSTALSLLACCIGLALPAASRVPAKDDGIMFRAQIPKPAFRSPALAPAKVTRLQGKAEVQHRPSRKPHKTVPKPTLFQLQPRKAMHVDASVPYKGCVMRLADGTKLDKLRDEKLFDSNPEHFIPDTVNADLRDAYVKQTVYKAFVRMDCSEFTALGANYYTAPDLYRSLMSGARNIVVGAAGDKGKKVRTPILRITLDGVIHLLRMDLPGLNLHSQNVMVVTDGQHLLAIDPRTQDTWHLQKYFIRRQPDHRWVKLTHTRQCLSGPNSI